MADYTTIDNPANHFNTVLYTGNGTAIGSGGNAITGVGFKPDFLWIKNRSSALHHGVFDVVRGTPKRLLTSSTAAEDSNAETVDSFDADGFTVGSNSNVNGSGNSLVAWNWKAGGSAPAITYSVKVVSDSGNKYRFDDFGTSAVTLDLQEGGTYTFDQSDSSNAGHPLRFSTTSNGTHGGGSEYTTGVTTTGTPGSSGAKTVITVAASAPTLYYYCTQHSGMGGQANTNSTFGSSNFSGSIQSTVSANPTAGFCICSWTGDGSDATIGHGLGAVPKMIIHKHRSGSVQWNVYHVGAGTGGYLRLDGTGAFTSNSGFFGTAPTSSVFSPGSHSYMSGSGNDNIAYIFADVQGYLKFGTYTGNGNADGTFIYTGFKPAWVMIKRTDNAQSWQMSDNKRDTFNVVNKGLFADGNFAESSSSSYYIDYLSNGFKLKNTANWFNASGATYIYMAFAESPFVNSNGVPTNAR